MNNLNCHESANNKNKRIKKENKETNKTINEDDSTDIFEKIENFTGLNRLGGKS